MTTQMTDISNFASDGSPCVFMSGKKNSLGEITNCNMALCKTFGYSKKELVGRKMNSLMPKIIGEHHDKFVQRNLDQIKISCCSTVGRDISSFGLHKTKYIFPISIKLICTPNLLNEMQYIAKIKLDKKHTSNFTAFLILNRKKEVTDITSSCVQMLNISHNTLNNYIVDMSILAPALTKKETLQTCLQKTGSRIMIYHPTIEHRQKADEAIFKDEIEILQKGDNCTEFQCKLHELSYEPVGKIGYVIKLDSIQEGTTYGMLAKSVKMPTFQFNYDEYLNIFVRELRDDENSAYNPVNSTSLSQMMSIYSHESGYSKSPAGASRRDLSELTADKFKMFSMCSGMSGGMSSRKRAGDTKSLYASRFAKRMVPKPELECPPTPQLERKNSFYSIFSEHSSSKINKSKHSSFFEVLLPKYKQLSKFVSDDTGTKNLMKVIENQTMYGEGIKTYRVINGEYIEIAEENYSQLLVKELETPQFTLGEGRRNVEKRKEEEYKIWRSRLRTKNDMKKLINETPYPVSVGIIKPFTLICMGILSILLIVEYAYTRYRLQDILNATDILGQSYSLKHLLLNLWYDSRELFLISSGIYTVFQKTYPFSNQYIDILRQRIDNTAYTANQLVDDLSGSRFSFTKDEKFFMENPLIQMYLYTNNTEDTKEYTITNYTIFQALLIDIESFAKIGKLEYFNKEKWLLFTGVDSLYSSLIYGAQKLINIFQNLLGRLSISSDTIDYFILSMSATDLFICLVIGWILSKFIESYEGRIMHIFLELPRKYMIQLNAQCENFISELQVFFLYRIVFRMLKINKKLKKGMKMMKKLLQR